MASSMQPISADAKHHHVTNDFWHDYLEHVAR
jgi:hypothetical protein